MTVGSGAGLLGFDSPQPCLELRHPGLCASVPVSVKWDDTVPDPRVCEALATVGLVRKNAPFMLPFCVSVLWATTLLDCFVFYCFKLLLLLSPRYFMLTYLNLFYQD